MAAIGKALQTGSQINNAAITTYYTATNLQARIDKCTVLNTSGSAATFDLYLVPVGGTAGVTNQVIKTHSVNVNETYTCPEIVGHWLNSGGFVQAQASAATALTLRISGIEVT